MAIALARLEAEGTVLRGSFTSGQEEEFCDRRILARIHRATMARLRQEVQPVSPASFIRFLFHWQHAASDSRLQGEGGLLEVVEQLQGFEAAAGAWEADLLGSRLSGYTPSLLDSLCLSGEVVWGRFSRRDTGGEPSGTWTALGRTRPISLALREDLPWVLDEPSGQEKPLSGVAREVLDLLSRRGASFIPDIVADIRQLPTGVEEALWQLVAAGLVTADSFGALRGRVNGMAKRAERASRFRGRSRYRHQTSRWSLLHTVAPAEDATRLGPLSS